MQSSSVVFVILVVRRRSVPATKWRATKCPREEMAGDEVSLRRKGRRRNGGDEMAVAKRRRWNGGGETAATKGGCTLIRISSKKEEQLWKHMRDLWCNTHITESITGEHGHSYRLLQLSYIWRISNQSNDCWCWNDYLHWWCFWNGSYLLFHMTYFKW